MALLGLIHRIVLGYGPKQFQTFFKLDAIARHPEGRECDRRHNRQLQTHRTGKYLDILGQLMLGLVDVYNLLPANIVAATDVSMFQTRLQKDLIHAAKGGICDWQKLYSPRLAIHAHPLRRFRTMSAIIPGGDTPVHGGAARRCVEAWLRFAQECGDDRGGRY